MEEQPSTQSAGAAAFPLAPQHRSSRRITITLPFSTYGRLLERAACEGRATSNLAAHLLEQGLDDAG